MRWIGRIALSCMIGLPHAISAQTQAEPPLSVIDWLGQHPRTPARPPERPAKPEEAPVALTALPPKITVTELGEGRPRAIGLVPASVTGMPQDLWTASDVSDIERGLDTLPDLHLPAARALFYTLMLAEGTAPLGVATMGDALARARVRALMETGALDPALSLIEQAGVATSPDHFDLWMQLSLLSGTEDRACKLLDQKPFLTSDYGTRILCAARAGKWENAALTLGSAQALDLLPEAKLNLLERFLNPELAEAAAALPPPRLMDPLSFRLLEAMGEPQPTRNLPPAYAVADLRDIAGWKTQLEAAERLTRIGALPDNRFLGIYTAREPAASGGIWDRVEALQRFDTALASGSPDAVTKTLRAAWVAMQEAELEVSFATLYADALQRIELSGSIAQLRDRILLLSPLYESVATSQSAAPTDGTDMAFLTAIARGEAPDTTPDTLFANGIASAFQTPTPRAALIDKARNGALGLAILETIALLENGARGDTAALRDALSTLRALGLEDTARRASLQIMLLDDR